MGSSLSLQRQPGLGTTARFELPQLAAAGSAEVQALLAPEAPTNAVKRARLL